MKKRLLTMLALLLFSTSSLLHADVLVSNLDEEINPNGPSIIGNTPFGVDNQVWGAQAFVTADDAWNLTSIEAIMGSASAAALPAFAELRRDTGTSEIDTSAAGLVATFGIPSLDGVNSIRSFSLAQTELLQANTKYWFVVGVDLPSTETFTWDYANTGNFDGPGALAEFGQSEDFGVTWSYPINPYFPWSLRVNGSTTAIPEPGSALIIGAVAVVGILRRRPQSR